MVFIYGGGFLIGTTEMYNAEGLAVNGDVVVVSMNYRVGVIGFLSTGKNILIAPLLPMGGKLLITINS